jgi:hypothetical protein
MFPSLSLAALAFSGVIQLGRLMTIGPGILGVGLIILA